MKEYPHIDSIFKRDMADGPNKGRFKLGEFSQIAFDYLQENQWVGTEKVDGTNIRVMWQEGTLEFRGKSDNATIPKFLETRLDDLFPTIRMNEVFPDHDVCLYGEGYGARIQKGGGNYIADGVSFVLFDVKVDHWWLKREDVEDIAKNLGIAIVPIVFNGTLQEAIDGVEQGFFSQWGDFPAEGLVLKPRVDLLMRSGGRVITKIKTKDFR